MAAVAGNGIVAVIADAESVVAAGQGQVFDVGWDCVGNTTIYRIDTFSPPLSNCIFDIIYMVDIIPVPTRHGICTAASVQSIIATATIKQVVTFVAAKNVVSVTAV